MIRAFKFLIIAALLFSCPVNAAGSSDAAENALPAPELEKIADGVWIHKSYEIIEPWGPILSQGLVIQTNAGVTLVDTAWTDRDTEQLLMLVEKETGALPSVAIVTHAHQDKMGGMNALIAAGVETYAAPMTNADAPTRDLTPAENIIALNDAEADFMPLIGPMDPRNPPAPMSAVYYPGAGHTRDNIVVYFPPAKVLFGGCLIRPGDANSLGNTADGDVANWADTVRKVAAAFPEAEIVIPSHGAMGGRELLDHTIALAEAAKTVAP